MRIITKGFSAIYTIFINKLFQLISPLEIFKNWWVYPLNGQARRMYNLSIISHYLRPKYVVETGTFMGSSTWFFLGVPSVEKVLSIESNQNSYEIAKARLLPVYGERIELIFGDSKISFDKILSGLSPDTTLLCYLDAHWEGDIPTTLELEALCRWGGNWVAIVDDFKIHASNPNGYGFDKYEDLQVDISIIPHDSSVQVFVPDEPATNETGAKRGTAYIFSERGRAMLPQSFLEELKLRPL